MVDNIEVLNFIENFHLNEDNGFAEGDVDYFISSIDKKKVPEFDYDTGATKLVIIPENRDYVIKIPFNGKYDYNWDSREDGFISFYGAEEDGWGDDYCAAEQLFYHRAEEAGYAEFFLKTEFEGNMYGYPIYTQKKVEDFCNYTPDEIQASYSSGDSRKSLKSNMIASLPYYWTAACLTAFNEDLEKLNDFISFLKETGILSDLHTGNLGFVNNKPVIVDYGGFYD